VFERHTHDRLRCCDPSRSRHEPSTVIRSDETVIDCPDECSRTVVADCVIEVDAFDSDTNDDTDEDDLAEVDAHVAVDRTVRVRRPRPHQKCPEVSRRLSDASELASRATPGRSMSVSESE
jgi:hypothetical protein